ncbi:MAG: hypothetical protein RR806_07460 [Oscillospiraceae bacterium]
MLTNKVIEKARKQMFIIAQKYSVSENSVIWMGDDKFTVVKEGQEIVIRIDENNELWKKI